MGGTLTILGCGGSSGVPAIGNWWGTCDPSEPKNIRTRPSIALQTANTLVIVDTGPDFREQVNRHALGCPDAIILTHAHSDHINGLDELRTLQRLYKRDRFPVHATVPTLEKLHERLGYMFKDMEQGFYPAVCDAHTVNGEAPIQVKDITLVPFDQDHGNVSSLGLRVGDIGYSTDVKSLDDKAYGILKGIETWIVDAGGHHSRSNPVHASLDEIYEMNAIIGARRVILTHLPATMDYAQLRHELRQGYEPAHDGMTLQWQDNGK